MIAGIRRKTVDRNHLLQALRDLEDPSLWIFEGSLARVGGG